MKRTGFSLLVTLLAFPSWGQDSTASNALSFSGYAEVYYQFDANKPADGNRPAYIYSHNRHNEFNLNLAYLKVAYKGKYSRANLAAAAGSYMNANYAAEPGVLKNVLEANAGVRLSNKRELWLDAGILPSHIGAESAVSRDCPVLTRSLVAENSPYFEAGARLSYQTENGNWKFSGLLLNGWQRITRLTGSTKVNWGTQIQYTPTEKVLINYSTFFGSDKPDSNLQNRVYHNLYGSITLSEDCTLTLGFDLGHEEKKGTLPGFNSWYAPLGILRYSFPQKWSMAARAEYYHDPQGVIIPFRNNAPFRAAGYSVNLDYAADKHMLIRIEGKTYSSREAIFVKGNQFSRKNGTLVMSMAVAF